MSLKSGEGSFSSFDVYVNVIAYLCEELCSSLLMQFMEELDST